MKLIVAIGAFIGIFFFNSGVAQDMESLARLHVGNGINVVKVFDSETKMVCYMAFYGTSGNTIDCLKGNGDKTMLIQSGHFFVDYLKKVNRVFDPEENIMCYIVSSSAGLPGTYGSVTMATLDCEKI